MSKVLHNLLVLSLTAALCSCGRGNRSEGFRTATITRGDLRVDISATGTVEPEEVIDVGAQVGGLIRGFGKDAAGKPIDYGSQVDEGMVLAEIDPSLYLSDVEQASAELDRAKADLLQLQSKLLQASRDWDRAQKLGPSDALSKSAYDAYQSGFEGAKASVAVGEAQVTQAAAALAKARRNLGYCTIKAPVKGVIIDKRVNVGQTVVSSLNAPSLFLIATDLRRMQVWVSVNEADVANIKPGQRVTFTIDAFPGQEFSGEVNKVRLNASMTQNVVTYVVEVNTDNSSGRLLPYLTANAHFHMENRDGVLLAPNAALRWTPRPSQIEKSESSASAAGKSETSTLWIADYHKVKALPVTIGPSDGLNTEVSGEGVSEGLEVVIGEADAGPAQGAQGTNNPFAPPPMPRGGRPK